MNDNNNKNSSIKEKISNLFTNVWIIAFLVIILLISLYPIVMFFIGLWKKCNGHFGYFLLNLIVIPFIFFGGANFVRGAFSVIQTDEKHFKTYWKFVIYLICTILGYMAFYAAIPLLTK